MTSPRIAPLAERDPSMPLALAALVSAASPEGEATLSDLGAAYRQNFRMCHQDVTGAAGPDVSGDEVHESLAHSVLPRLATEGWILDTSGTEWNTVRAVGDWWTEASADRDGTRDGLLDLGRAGFRRSASLLKGGAEGSGSLLEGKGLSKSFKRRRVVNEVSVRLGQGEIVGLLGPNGCGKTTTFYLLTGLLRPETGTVTLDGKDMTTAPMYRRARQGIGYLAQEPSVFRRLSVEDNIMAILETMPVSREERRRRLEQLLDELSIKHLRKNKAYSLSGGERRRLEITRALVTNPKFMLLDEPFAGVDPIAVHDIQTIVAGLRLRGIGVLITDHNVEQTLDIVDRAYIMFEGRIQVSGPVRDLVYDERVASLYLGPTLTARLRSRLEAVA